MKNQQRIVLAGAMCLYGILNAGEHVVIDKIVARVNGVIILKSELTAPHIEKEGGTSSLEELIMSELWIQEAEKKHILPTDADIERQVVAFKIQNEMGDLSDADFEKQLKQSGFTLKTYKQQLGRMIAIENVKRSEVHDKIFISSQEVERYYNEHPLHTKEAYHLKLARVSKDKLDDKTQYSWEDLGWVAQKDLRKDYVFVSKLSKGEVAKPIKLGEEYHVVMLLDKRERRLKKLNERYVKIEKNLFQQKKDKHLAEIEKNIKEKASITHF